ncbi:MAG: CtpF protein, partial [Hyphomicrobiales bacterium]
LDRILTKCTDHLNLLTAPAILDRMYEYTEEEIDGLVEVAQSSVPYFVMDLPYLWNDWMAATLTSADEVVITTTPDLAGLRNAKNLFDTLKQKRKTDPKPHIILNQVDRSKETEIKVGAFEDALETKVTLSIPFEPVVFGTAMNNGQMIAESNPRSPTVAKFKALAANLTGRTEAASMEKSGMKVPFLDKFRGKKQAS